MFTAGKLLCVLSLTPTNTKDTKSFSYIYLTFLSSVSVLSICYPAGACCVFFVVVVFIPHCLIRCLIYKLLFDIIPVFLKIQSETFLDRVCVCVCGGQCQALIQPSASGSSPEK